MQKRTENGRQMSIHTKQSSTAKRETYQYVSKLIANQITLVETFEKNQTVGRCVSTLIVGIYHYVSTLIVNQSPLISSRYV